MKDSFVLYTKYMKQISKLNMAQRGVLFTALFCYQSEEALPEMDELTDMVFSFICDRIDEDNERYKKTCEARKAAGELGGAPKGNKNAKKTTETSKQAKQSKGCFNEKTENISDCNTCSKTEKQPKQAKQTKQPDNECEYDYEYEYDNNHSLTAGVHAREESDRKMTCADFLAKYPNVYPNVNAAIYDFDWDLLDEKFQASTKYLQGEPHDLSWVKNNYRRIIGDVYRDKHENTNDMGYNGMAFFDEITESLKAREVKVNDG